MARRRQRQSKGTPTDSRQVPQGGGAIATWHDRPDWITPGSYEEFGAGIIGGELASRLAEDHRRVDSAPSREGSEGSPPEERSSTHA
jgi:hypothetical protein